MKKFIKLNLSITDMVDLPLELMETGWLEDIVVSDACIHDSGESNNYIPSSPSNSSPNYEGLNNFE